MSAAAPPVRVVVFGLGLAGRVLHLPALRRVPGIEVVAAADPDVRTHDNAGCQAFADWREALDVPADAVVVASPPSTHAEVAIAALQRGRHVYLEKPVATSPDAARAVAAAVPPRAIVQLGFAYRFHPLWRRAAALLAEGRLRPPLRATGRFASPRSGNGWSAPIVDVGCHHVDLLSWLLGAPAVAVQATPGGCLRVTWADGSELTGEYTTGPDDDWVVADDGRHTVSVDRVRGIRLGGGARLLGRHALPPPSLAAIHLLRPGWERSFEFAFRAFRDAVTRGSPAPGDPGIGAGLAAAAVGEATLAALESGGPVAVAPAVMLGR